MRCQQSIKRGGKSHKCKNNAIDGCKYCYAHNPKAVNDCESDAETEMVSDEECEPELPVPPQAKAYKQPYVPVPVPEKTLVITEKALMLLVQKVSDLTLTMANKATPKKEVNKQNKLVERAKYILYHEAKKEKAFVDAVRASYNVTTSKVPWVLIKTKSDLYWDSLEPGMKQAYIEKARAEC